MGNKRQFVQMAGSIIRNLPFSFSLGPYSNILFVSDNANWVLKWEISEIGKVAEMLGYSVRYSNKIPIGLPRQSIFFPSKYILLHPQRYFFGNTRVGFPYFHGYPSSEAPVFNKCFENLKKYHSEIACIQVSHSIMKEMILATGIDPSKIFQIPIGINLDFFSRQTRESRKEMRDKFGLPQSAVIIGSFQKDGEGWGDGMSPKLIKGPDVFLESIKLLKNSIDNLFVLLSGPSRGFVKKGLEEIGVPYKHFFLEDYHGISRLYQCLDLYLVTSREEGGPKAILESMSSGVPIVTTRVGQAMDLVRHGKNGWVVGVGDVEGLVHWVERAIDDQQETQKILIEGFKTAESESYFAQKDRWQAFFKKMITEEPC